MNAPDRKHRVILRDLTSGDVHELAADTPCLDYATDARDSVSMLPDYDGAVDLGGCEIGDRVYVRSTDVDVDDIDRVLWWASEVLSKSAATAKSLPFPEAEYNVAVYVQADQPGKSFATAVDGDKLPYMRRVRVHPTEWPLLLEDIKAAFERMYDRRGV